MKKKTVLCVVVGVVFFLRCVLYIFQDCLLLWSCSRYFCDIFGFYSIFKVFIWFSCVRTHISNSFRISLLLSHSVFTFLVHGAWHLLISIRAHSIAFSFGHYISNATERTQYVLKMYEIWADCVRAPIFAHSYVCVCLFVYFCYEL